MVKLIIGLGNPGDEYEDTYHNVGALALMALAQTAGKTSGKTLRFKSHKKLFRYAELRGLALVLPLTFMNESGAAAAAALRKFGALPSEMAVLHDESDLAVGTYQLASGKSSAGHRGVQSIMDAVHSEAFLRGRIGIRDSKEQKRKKASEFVLAKIKPADRKKLDEVFTEISEELLKIPTDSES